MTRLLVPLTALGLFCALASYSYGRHEPGHRQAVARHAAAPVVLSRDTGTVYAMLPDCGLDWLCLVEQAERKSPTKHKKGRRS